MPGINLIKCCFALLVFISANTMAADNTIVDHYDPISVDHTLSLQSIIAITLEKYPDRLLNDALQREAKTLQNRGNSWVAGASSLSVSYLDDIVGDDTGYRELSAEVEIPIWNWNQRASGQQVAEKAQQSADQQSAALKLQVTALVRSALWNLTLANIRYQQSTDVLDISEQLLKKIKQRVDLGDLPRSDYLLANSDYLQKRSMITQAEAEVMHARNDYSSLTGLTRIPEDFRESKSRIDAITNNHPLLLYINTIIERKQAEIDWIKSRGSCQTTFQLGMKSERDQRGGRDIESAGVGISIPFGGQSFLAPEISKANLELNQVKAEREHLHRKLQKNLHEAKHALQIDRTELAIANELKQIANKHLKMTQLSFSAGEINLLDLLKIQGRAYQAIQHAKEFEIRHQRNIALYNQVVGVQP